MGGDGVNSVGSTGADGTVAQDDLGGDLADRIVARTYEGAGPVRAGGGPAFLPSAEELGGARTKWRRTGDAHAVLVGQEQEGFGASQQWGFAVMGDERGLEFADGGSDGGGDVPSVTGEREIGATHGEFELDEAAAVNGFAGDYGDA